MALPLTGSLLTRYNNLPAIPPEEPLGDLLNSIGGGGSGYTIPAVTTVSEVLTTTGQLLRVDSSAGAVQLTLPSAPADGAVVTVKWTAGPEALTVIPTGVGTIDGESSFAFLSVNQSVVFVHVGSDVWVVV
jgi:hypothetical protein